MSSDIELAKVFAAANQYLKGVNAKIALVRRGEMLYWQGTLPPKPHSKRDRPYQQNCSSGLPYTKAGIGRAKKRAVIIGNQVALGEFDWTEYPMYRTKIEQPPESLSAAGVESNSVGCA
mgnify:CR=1 FL=1